MRQAAKSTLKVLLGGVTALAVMAQTGQAQIFDFENAPASHGVIPLPALGAFDSTLAATLNGQTIKAAKVTSPLSDSDASQWFNAVDFDFVFSDFESFGRVTKTKTLIRQIDGGSLEGGPGTLSGGAVVGNFSFDPLSPDDTQSDPNVGIPTSSYLRLNKKIVSGSLQTLDVVRMSNDVLYPGSPSFRPTTNDNKRVGLFTLPITRFSGVQQELANLPAGDDDDKHIPYVTRFNNWGNSDFNTGLEVGPAEGTEGQQFIYDAREGATNEGQLLSRGDFQAMVAHYRLRGADGVTLFQPGVIGYTKNQMRQDAANGWNTLQFAFDAGSDPVSATEGADLLDSISEEDGTVWSGLVNEDLMVILLSNLDDENQEVTLPEMIAGHPVFPDDRTLNISALSHNGLEFSLDGDFWLLDDVLPVFNGVGLTDRTGIGVPEPASLVMLAIGSLLVGLPRSRRRLL